MSVTDRLADYQRFVPFEAAARWEHRAWWLGYGHTHPELNKKSVCSEYEASVWLKLDDGRAQERLDLDPAWTSSAGAAPKLPGVGWNWRRDLDDGRRDALIELVWAGAKLVALGDVRGHLMEHEWTRAGHALARVSVPLVKDGAHGDFLLELLVTGLRPALEAAAA
ncbi:MAG TPA: hypothetical protein VGF33_03020 [Caulobacteraceae bacterium]|jgi:hypothetical protein